MGFTDNKRPPLPAPTESDSASVVAPTDVATDLSRQTDRTSYSLPDDGSPVVVPVKKSKSDKSGHSKSQSQTSLLIEYFEYGNGKPTSKSGSRPSVRVKVTPSSKKQRDSNSDSVRITELGKDRRPSHTRRISLGNKGEARGIEGSEISQLSEQDVDGQAPIEVEFPNQSEVSSIPPRFIQTASDISSMPGDSMLEGPTMGRSQEKMTNRGLEQTEQVEDIIQDSLKAPETKRSRSISRERITQKVLEKLAQDRMTTDASGRKKVQISRPTSKGTDLVEENLKAHSRRSSRSNKDDDARSVTESSLLRPRDQDSNVSGASKVSINNPRLISTVEDVVRRLILPEIETMKRQQSVRESKTTFDSGTRDSFGSYSSLSRQGMSREISKSSSAPHMKSKATLSRDENDPTTGLTGDSPRRRKHRRSSRDSASEKTSSRRGSLDSVGREKERIRKSKESGHSRELSGTALTASALEGHDSRSSLDTYEDTRRERRKKRSKSRSGSNSIANTDEEYYNPNAVPPMPMRSEMNDSELTRDSILSAETNETDLSRSQDSATPVREVSRGSARTVPRTSSASRQAAPSPLSENPRPDRGLTSARSDRSLSKTKAAGLAAAGLTGAAAALYGHHRAGNSNQTDADAKTRSYSRDVSPIPGDYGTTDQVTAKMNVYGDAALSSRAPEHLQTGARFVESNAVEEGDNLDGDTLEDGRDLVKDLDMDNFYENQRQVNNEYRLSQDMESQIGSGVSDPSNIEHPNSSFDRITTAQEVRDIGANPEFVHTPPGVESAVASLMEGSTVNSDRSIPREQLYSKYDNEYRDNAQNRDVGQPTARGHETFVPMQHDNASGERWKAIKGRAQQLSHDSLGNDQRSLNSNRPSFNESIKSEGIQLGASGLPVSNDPMPEIGYGADSDILTNHSLERDQSSVLEEPMGDEYENRDHWPYEPTPPQTKRQGFVETDDHDGPYIGAGKAALIGTGVAGLGIGGAAALASKNGKDQSQPSLRQEPSLGDRQQQQTRGFGQTNDVFMDTPGNQKDEGYMSAANIRSPDVSSPLSFSKPPPKLFDEGDVRDLDNSPIQGAQFQSEKRERYLSGNSHGMDANFYDASTGRGINNIQSKDVVALMDHLTVRDGQRSARDTEILVTLVRTAAEMRTSFDEMKKHMDHQNSVTMARSDQNTERTMRSLAGTRSPRAPSTSEILPGKKKNIFQRALRGLGSRSTTDLSRIEDMLTHLLDEVEDLKITQYGQGGAVSQQMSQKTGMDSYERLRAAPDSGYEPQAQAGTSSGASFSGPLDSSPFSRGSKMHSGYTVTQDPGNRISTVVEGDEDFDGIDRGFEDDEGMLTPTQEAQHQRFLSYETPSKMPGSKDPYSSDTTPGSNEKSTKHKSNGSSLFGIPKISRWSKTTTSTDRSSYQRDPGYSMESRSGSQVDVIPNGGMYSPADEDRLRSSTSLPRDDLQQARSPSPLIPDPSRVSMEDPKYHANRHSLTLEHPQPRQGNTHRHQNHLETQAQVYGPAYPSGASTVSRQFSPDSSDAFGTTPSLARWAANNRLSNAQQYTKDLSPISSEGGYSARSTGDRPSQPPLPPKIRDEGPLVPPKVPLDESHQVHSPNNTRENRNTIIEDDMEDDYDHSGEEDADHDVYNEEEDDRTTEEYSPEIPQQPEVLPDEKIAYPPAPEINPIPLERKRSPYSPGGLLAPIEERYSLELTRSPASTPKDFLDDDSRSSTPMQTTPQRALGADLRGATDGGVRKLTGPREMPRNASGGSGGSGGIVRGTVRRKPIPDEF